MSILFNISSTGLLSSTVVLGGFSRFGPCLVTKYCELDRAIFLVRIFAGGANSGGCLTPARNTGAIARRIFICI